MSEPERFEGDSVLMDLDGTLVDSAQMVAKALNALCQDRGAPPVAVGTVRDWISLGADFLVASALGSYAGDPTTDLAGFRDILKRTPADRQIICPGVEEALRALSEGGLRLAIVTNKPQALSEQLLTDLGLSRWFKAVVGGDSTAFSKPHPEPLRLALTTIGGSPSVACMVGDSIVDAEAAARLAIPFYLYSAGYGAAHCPSSLVRHDFKDFGALPGLLLNQVDM